MDASEELRGNKELVLAAIKENGIILWYSSDRLKSDKEIVLTAVQQDSYALEYASKELKKDKLFLIECYKINKKTTYINKFIRKFDNLENGYFDDTFIKGNVDILDLVENKEQLCKYLLDNEQYNIIYQNEELAKYIKENNNIIIFSYNDINIEKDHCNDELKKQFRNNNKLYNVIFID